MILLWRPTHCLYSIFFSVWEQSSDFSLINTDISVLSQIFSCWQVVKHEYMYTHTVGETKHLSPWLHSPRWPPVGMAKLNLPVLLITKESKRWHSCKRRRTDLWQLTLLQYYLCMIFPGILWNLETWFFENQAVVKWIGSSSKMGWLFLYDVWSQEASYFLGGCLWARVNRDIFQIFITRVMSPHLNQLFKCTFSRIYCEVCFFISEIFRTVT